jgi:16S rRNA (cytidine1402-2'-O)-methyltransferase
MVFYESVHRVAATLADLAAAFGKDRPAFLGRELTKLHEQCVRATLGEILEQITAGAITSKGEFAIVVAGSPETKAAAFDLDCLLVELAGKLPDKELARAVARATGEKRNIVYQRLLDLAQRDRQD